VGGVFMQVQSIKDKVQRIKGVGQVEARSESFTMLLSPHREGRRNLFRGGGMTGIDSHGVPPSRKGAAELLRTGYAPSRTFNSSACLLYFVLLITYYGHVTFSGVHRYIRRGLLKRPGSEQKR
jgi:hypothetical protein